MNLQKIMEKIGVKILSDGKESCIEIDRVFAGDKMSDLLEKASETSLLITNLNNTQLVRIAELMEVPAICLPNNAIPSQELIRKAKENAITIIVSPHDMFETCGRIYQGLHDNSKPGP